MPGAHPPPLALQVGNVYGLCDVTLENALFFLDSFMATALYRGQNMIAADYQARRASGSWLRSQHPPLEPPHRIFLVFFGTKCAYDPPP